MMKSRWVFSAALALVMAVSPAPVTAQQNAEATPPAAPVRPEIFLTWNAPYGSPRATDQLNRACAGENGPHADTLYLAYRLRESRDELIGVEGSIYIHAQFDDTLSAAWDDAELGKIPDWLTAEFPTGNEEGFRAGWQSTGMGFPLYFKEETRGLFRAIYAVRADRAAPIEAGPIYTFARLIIDRHSSEFEDCDQGLCVEWIDAVFTFGINLPTVRGELGRRCFVSVNSPQGLACSKYRVIAQRRGYLTKPPMPGDSY